MTTAGAADPSSSKSSAIDLIQQSQQGFAKLESEAKVKAEAAGRTSKTMASASGEKTVAAKAGASTKVAAADESTAAAKHPVNDGGTNAAAARVTALYLANGDNDTSAKRAA